MNQEKFKATLAQVEMDAGELQLVLGVDVPLDGRGQVLRLIRLARHGTTAIHLLTLLWDDLPAAYREHHSHRDEIESLLSVYE